MTDYSPLSSCSASTGRRPTDVRTKFAAICGTVLLLTAVLAGVGSVATDRARAATTTVDSCRTITEPGTYRLTTDLQSDGTCIEIRASNVVFDGGGHAITGPDTTIKHDVGTPAENGEYVIPDGVDVGVLVNGTDDELGNVTVKNVVVTEFVNGVTYADVSGGTITNVRAVGNGLDGFSLGADDLRVLDNVAAENGAYGFSFVTDSDGNYLRNNVAKRNTQTGIVFIANNNENRLVENVAHHNGNYGIGLYGGSGNTLVENTMYANDWQDLWDTGTNDVRPNNRYREPENSADESHEHETPTTATTTTTETTSTTTTTTRTTTETASTTTTTRTTSQTTTATTATTSQTTTTTQTTSQTTTETTTKTTSQETNEETTTTTAASNEETTTDESPTTATTTATQTGSETTTETGSETDDGGSTSGRTGDGESGSTGSEGGSGGSSGESSGGQTETGSSGQGADETTTRERSSTASTTTTAATTTSTELTTTTTATTTIATPPTTATTEAALTTTAGTAGVASAATESPTATGVATGRSSEAGTDARRVVTRNSDRGENEWGTAATKSQTKTTGASGLQSVISQVLSFVGVTAGTVLVIRRK